VIAANQARITGGDAATGSNVYDGDRLSTEAHGKLQIRSGSAQLYLQGSSDATLEFSGPARCLRLLAGTALFSTGLNSSFQLCARDARIYPLPGAPVVAQVSVVGPKELVVSSRRGALAVTVDNDTKTIAEGTSYRVILDPPADFGPQEPQGAGTSGTPRKPWRDRFLLVKIIGLAAVAGGLTYVGVDEALESPDRP